MNETIFYRLLIIKELLNMFNLNHLYSNLSLKTTSTLSKSTAYIYIGIRVFNRLVVLENANLSFEVS